MNKLNKTSDGSYIFQVEITVSATSNGAALEKLLRVLNNGELVDYRIGSGITPPQHNPFESRIRQYIESNRLIRLNINKGRGVKMNIPCRVINFDVDSQVLTVYHVDEKQVYSMGLNEIDDFITE
jgi:hypothetical protein